MSERDHIRITSVRRHPLNGYWTAHVTTHGQTVHVDRRYGSWQAQSGVRRRDVTPHLARALQERVRPIERVERREVGEAMAAERRRRLREFRELKPSDRDAKRYSEQLFGDLQAELRGRPLEHVFTTDALAWARPASWGASAPSAVPAGR